MEQPANQGPWNPYESPSPAEPSQTLSRLERAVLEFYWTYRHRAPSLLGLMVKSLPRWALLAIMIAFALLLVYALAGRMIDRGAVNLFLGLMTGIVCRDIGHIRRTIRVWPLYSQLLKWDVVEQQLYPESPPIR